MNKKNLEREIKTHTRLMYGGVFLLFITGLYTAFGSPVDFEHGMYGQFQGVDVDYTRVASALVALLSLWFTFSQARTADKIRAQPKKTNT